MKTIYRDIIERLQTKVPAIRYIDMDYGQLEQSQPSVAYPCALISLNFPDCRNLTDDIQDCKAEIIVRLAFDPLNAGSTAAHAPEEVRERSLTPYDTIADVYTALQAFNDMSRKAQGKENRNDLFIYKMVFRKEFEDYTASEQA